jgi:predicted transcriptional regulator
MAVRADAERVMVTLDPHQVEFLDRMATKMDRSRSWLVATALDRWSQKLEREAERRAKQRAKRAKSAAGQGR